MSKSLLDRGIVAVENIDWKGDRWAAFQVNGALKISEFSKLTEGQEIVLKNWEEIERLRNFLNSLKPVKKPEEVVIHAATA
ncbi:hypothetical protein [Brevibacillus sp. BC25]|uniref:hypothetical protein n=1 Tax=Brevibacillus sp. BC25 TaxID=1144308 RepID=UPI0002713061|nr:hypothetical protein [Brevibacillus sp. BC25]EJL29992.1 hypothetical protein PMI05_01608 [Brevibacillus sp. BC25]